MHRMRSGVFALLVIIACKGDGDDGSGSTGETGTGDETGGNCPDCGAVEWVVDLAATDAVSAYAVAVDGDGGVVVVGAFNDTLEIEGELLETAGAFDAFVAKLSASGELSWAKRFGEAGYDGVSGLGLDAAGNIYVFGDLDGEVDLGDGVVPNPDGLGAWVASYDPSGAHRFSKLLGPGGTLAALALDAQPDGGFVISGYYEGSPDFGDGALPAADNRDAFVASFDADQNVRWARGYGSSGGQSLDYGADVAIDAAGTVYLALGVQGQLDLGDGPINDGDDGDGVLVVLDPDGTLHASRLLASDARDSITGVALGASGQVLVTGDLRSLGADLGDGEPKQNGGLYAAAYDSDAAHLWSRVVTPGLTRPWGITGVGQSDAAIGAQFTGATDFGGGPLPDTGDNDVVVARYTDTGAHLWSRSFSGMNDAYARAIAGTPDDALVAVGDYNGTLDFDGTNLSAVGRSGFVVRLSP